MSFYSNMSTYYDEIFPIDHSDLGYWLNKLKGCRAILDIGCGTGNKTVFFASSDNSIIGIDLDEGMISRASKENHRPNIRYEVMNMASIADHFTKGSFDGILCLGNSLVHLSDKKSIHGLLESMGTLLAPGGLCLIQILNYDRILDKNVKALPLIETENVIFDRAYERRGDTIDFNTTLTLKKTGKTWTNTSPLYPLRRSELEEGLTKAGFEETELYGTYQGGPFEEDSFLTISLSKKR